MRTLFNITTFLFLLTIGMTTMKGKNEIRLEDIFYFNQQLKNLPKVEVKISLNDSLYKSDEKILVEITLTNKSNKIQKLLFDKPRTGTGGPWATSADVINNLTNESVLKYGNKLLL